MTVQASTHVSRDDARPASPRPSSAHLDLPPLWRAGEWTVHPLVWLVAGLTALLRVPYLRVPMTPDEGGFLLVGGHWHRGASLYGSYWVDRPPLLIALFRAADLAGGLPALRLLGCLVAAATVLGAALAAGQAVRGSRWAPVAASVVVGALLVTPSGGVMPVNGELLAAPFIAFGLYAALRAVRHSPRAWLAALVAGACGAAAVLVKQNMLDVGVFALVLGLVALCQREEPARWLGRQAVLALAGAVACAAAILGLAMLAGTHPGAVYQAMYPFRLQAAATVQHLSWPERLQHLQSMAISWAATGGPVLIAGFLLWCLRRGPAVRALAPAVIATVALLAYDTVSVVAGGSYWLHYMVQLAVPLGLVAGLMVSGARRWGVPLVAVVLVGSSIGWGSGLFIRTTASGPVIGQALRSVAQPGDSVVSLFGDPDIVTSSGLPSPYTYPWSLPARTLDPRMTQLATTLAGPEAPSWVIIRGPRTDRLIRSGAAGPELVNRYHQVARLCSHEVFLRDDLVRTAPVADAGCTLPFVPGVGDTSNGAHP